MKYGGLQAAKSYCPCSGPAVQSCRRSPQVAADRRDVRGVGVFGQGRGAEGGRGGVDLQRGAGAAVPGVVPNE